MFGELGLAEFELLCCNSRPAFVIGSLDVEPLDGDAERFSLLGDLHLARTQAVLARIEIRFAFTKFGAVLVKLRVGRDFRGREGLDLLTQLGDFLFQLSFTLDEQMLALGAPQPRSPHLAFELGDAGVELSFAMIDLLLLGSQVAGQLAGLCADLLARVRGHVAGGNQSQLARPRAQLQRFLRADRMCGVDSRYTSARGRFLGLRHVTVLSIEWLLAHRFDLIVKLCHMDDRTIRRISEAKNRYVAGTAAIERRYGAGAMPLNLTGAIDVCAGVESMPLGPLCARPFFPTAGVKRAFPVCFPKEIWWTTQA